MLSNDEMKLLNEMKDNCIKQANYVDSNAMLKYNLLTKLSFISQKIENIQKILVNSKEYAMAVAMELNDKQSVLIEIINEIDKEV
jgi:proline dehydrogenase